MLTNCWTFSFFSLHKCVHSIIEAKKIAEITRMAYKCSHLSIIREEKLAVYVIIEKVKIL